MDEHEPEIDEARSEPEKPRDTPEPAEAKPEPTEPENSAKAAAKVAKAPARSEPFWNSKGFVAFLALIGASIAPVMSWIAKDAEIRLAEADHAHTQALAAQEQRHKIRMDYFSRAIDPVNEADYRERVLRFLRRSEDDEPLREWAQEELEIIAPEAAARRAEEEENRTRLRALARQVREAQTRAETETGEERARRVRAERELAEARGELADVHRLAECRAEMDRCSRECLAETDLAARFRARLEIARLPESERPAADALDRAVAERASVLGCTRRCTDTFIRCRYADDGP